LLVHTTSVALTCSFATCPHFGQLQMKVDLPVVAIRYKTISRGFVPQPPTDQIRHATQSAGGVPAGLQNGAAVRDVVESLRRRAGLKAPYLLRSAVPTGDRRRVPSASGRDYAVPVASLRHELRHTYCRAEWALAARRERLPTERRAGHSPVPLTLRVRGPSRAYRPKTRRKPSPIRRPTTRSRRAALRAPVGRVALALSLCSGSSCGLRARTPCVSDHFAPSRPRSWFRRSRSHRARSRGADSSP